LNTNQKREALKKAFPGAKWAEKVRQMTEAQVVAIYLNLKRQNKL
jgi:hypothetical protein